MEGSPTSSRPRAAEQEPLPISRRSWRQEVKNRVRDLECELSLALAAPRPLTELELAEYTAIVELNLELARQAAAQKSWNPLKSFLGWASGAAVETAWHAIHAAEAMLLMIGSSDWVRARLFELQASVITTLGRDDGRVTTYANLLEKAKDEPDRYREQLRVIKATVDSASDEAHKNVRSYRNWLLVIGAVVGAGLLGFGFGHWANAEFLEIQAGSFEADLGQIEFAGALGGLLMALFALIRLRVYSGPFALPLWQALIRIPAGATAALVGVYFLQGKLLSSLRSESDRTALLAYAVLFGAAPEIVLRFLDNKVNDVSAAARTKNDPLKPVSTEAQPKPTQLSDSG
jgi:hypothetical protein